MSFRFEILHQSSRSRARVGRIHTPHGIIDTPGFVGVGTNGTMKTLCSKQVSEIGLQLMFCNTYHLMLQPGPELVREMGGLHRFMNRDMPLITDSGGFQVFSLTYGGVADEIKSKGVKKTDGAVLKITEEGVLFRSYRDGRTVMLTPESSVQAQKDFGADIIIPLDELPPYHMDPRALKESLERTHRWEKRSLDTHLANTSGQAMYAVIHGGLCPELRRQSCTTLTALPFDGYAIGGSVGKNLEEMIELLQVTLPQLPAEKPNHLLGIGDCPSLERCIPLGLDTFDSSYPTKAARHGLILTSQGSYDIKKRAHARSLEALDPECTCHSCTHYSRAYLHHLFKAKEPTAGSLASIHNLHFMVRLMERYRQQILKDEI